MKKHILLIAIATFGLSSCNDFLEREPLDFGNETTYFKTDNDLKISVNEFYSLLPKSTEWSGGPYNVDVNSDDQFGGGPNALLYEGSKRTPKMEDESNQWNFKSLRGINFFINKTEERYEHITGNRILVDHYLGEGYFFRAWEYFRLLRNFGDAPIFTEMLPDDPSVLISATNRRPRNEVARFILEQLDRAIGLLQQVAPESGRITRDAALTLKSRVALYEGTWEKYHAGTCFVPGNPKWVGAPYWPDFQFKTGSAEAEVYFFLEEAYKAAELVADSRDLDKDYQAMFNNWESVFPDNSEVILARYYQEGVLVHSCSAFLRSGGGLGMTRAAVNSFLMKSGLPIYADPEYQGDKDSYHEFMGRDTRLTESVRAAGSDISTRFDPELNKYVNDTTFFYLPYITSQGASRATTGYEVCKWVSEDEIQQLQTRTTTATPIFRAAECYLNYIEAYYERHGDLGGKCGAYWTKLRKRAGVDTDYQKTIDATVLDKENDLAVWSKGVAVSPTLYNIRRERRCEFIAEAMRLDDLKRWRSLDKMRAYQPEGFNLWEELYKVYEAQGGKDNDLNDKNLSPKANGNYLRPLQSTTTSIAYNGYNFPKAHYLEPIPVSEFLLTIDPATGKSVLYQNPGWPTNSDGTADYNYDCD